MVSFGRIGDKKESDVGCEENDAKYDGGQNELVHCCLCFLLPEEMGKKRNLTAIFPTPNKKQQSATAQMSSQIKRPTILYLVIGFLIASHLSYLLVSQWNSYKNEILMKNNVDNVIELNEPGVVATGDMPSLETLSQKVSSLIRLIRSKREQLSSLSIGNGDVTVHGKSTDELEEYLKSSSSLSSSSSDLSMIEIVQFLNRSPTKEEQLLIADYLFERQKLLARTFAARDEAKQYTDEQKLREVFSVFEPIVSCTTVNRVGSRGDGGKWLCDSWKLTKANLKRSCITYSWGSNRDYTFETDMIKSYDCDVFTFDPTTPFDAKNTYVPRNKFKYYNWGLGPGVDGSTELKGNPLKTLPGTISELGHTEVDVQKIDCELCEVEGVGKLFEDPVLAEQFMKAKPKMILMETHARSTFVNYRMYRLIEGLKSLGFYMFYREVNAQCVFCMEYGFVHRDYFLQ